MSNSEFLQTFDEKFETSDLLDAVKHLDVLRQALSDDEDWKPPAIRQDLLKLHQLAMAVSHRGDISQAQAMFDLAFELEDQLFDVCGSCKAIEKTLQTITDFPMSSIMRTLTTRKNSTANMSTSQLVYLKT